MRSARTPLAAAAVACGLLLAACGGGDAATDPGAADGAAGATLPEPAAGPVPELEVAAASVEASPLPAIAVRQLNGEGGWVQFKNELPSEQPLLIWFWAPF